MLNASTATPGDDVTAAPTDRRDDDALLHVVEELGLMLTDAGMPRMPARVFAYVLAEDATTYTAKELAQGLRVSPAAISGAVRQLVGAGLLARSRAPGARSDHYRIAEEDVWAAIAAQRIPLLERWEQAMAKAARELGPDTKGGRRLLETQAYFRFFRDELHELPERWRSRKRELIAEVEGEIG